MKSILKVPSVYIRFDIFILYDSYIINSSYEQILNTRKYGIGFVNYKDIFIWINNNVGNTNLTISKI